ncbi:hypothetical protein ISF6_3907 [Piscinibacter sakaiensis]|uniref:Uncharacterized protein n=1 Tax=Piscinibacter sakaiensis TaxID=1547922 RepID=A0A0K8NUT0_PISS1|nr:hypothetical protein ISF6_3907 [Piscinibacter sakaiensis]
MSDCGNRPGSAENQPHQQRAGPARHVWPCGTRLTPYGCHFVFSLRAARSAGHMGDPGSEHGGDTVSLPRRRPRGRPTKERECTQAVRPNQAGCVLVTAIAPGARRRSESAGALRLPGAAPAHLPTRQWTPAPPKPPSGAAGHGTGSCRERTSAAESSHRPARRNSRSSISATSHPDRAVTDPALRPSDARTPQEPPQCRRPVLRRLPGTCPRSRRIAGRPSMRWQRPSRDRTATPTGPEGPSGEAVDGCET